MKEIYSTKNADGWIYYIDSGFAWIPMYMQGSLIWLSKYWFTWPEKDGKVILAGDVLPELNDKTRYPNGALAKEQMYKVYYPYDPRKK